MNKPFLESHSKPIVSMFQIANSPRQKRVRMSSNATFWSRCFHVCARSDPHILFLADGKWVDFNIDKNSVPRHHPNLESLWRPGAFGFYNNGGFVACGGRNTPHECKVYSFEDKEIHSRPNMPTPRAYGMAYAYSGEEVVVAGGVGDVSGTRLGGDTNGTNTVDTTKASHTPSRFLSQNDRRVRVAREHVVQVGL